MIRKLWTVQCQIIWEGWVGSLWGGLIARSVLLDRPFPKVQSSCGYNLSQPQTCSDSVVRTVSVLLVASSTKAGVTVCWTTTHWMGLTSFLVHVGVLIASTSKQVCHQNWINPSIKIQSFGLNTKAIIRDNAKQQMGMHAFLTTRQSRSTLCLTLRKSCTLTRSDSLRTTDEPECRYPGIW